MALDIVILAAGKGNRMRSALPKVLHKLAGRPMLDHVIATARSLQPDKIFVVYGHGGETVKECFNSSDICWIYQREQLGTGHAVMQALPSIGENRDVLILYGDVPLISQSTLQNLLIQKNKYDIALLTVFLEEPKGYGRIVRLAEGGCIEGIVEDRDATVDEAKINEVNTGIIVLSSDKLRQLVSQLNNDNSQAEYYLTDIVKNARLSNNNIGAVVSPDVFEVLGVNSKEQLAEVERVYQRGIAKGLLASGVTLYDPSRIDVRGSLQTGADVTIDVNVIFEGNVIIGDRVAIGPNSYIKNAIIKDDVTIFANCVIEEAEVGDNCRVGPFARLRPGTILASEVHIGNFVEIKKSQIGQASKVNHLTYIGDTEIGSRVNIGAGTITCNYDGANKHKTIIGDDVFVGSNTQLVAPVEIGRGATIGAGSTITKNVVEDVLTVARSPLKTIKKWKRPVKKK